MATSPCTSTASFVSLLTAFSSPTRSAWMHGKNLFMEEESGDSCHGDSCSGDSGGPATAKTSAKTKLVGIVSWGPDRCGAPKMPGVYTKVSQYTEWVRMWQRRSYCLVEADLSTAYFPAGAHVIAKPAFHMVFLRDPAEKWPACRPPMQAITVRNPVLLRRPSARPLPVGSPPGTAGARNPSSVSRKLLSLSCWLFPGARSSLACVRQGWGASDQSPRSQTFRRTERPVDRRWR